MKIYKHSEINSDRFIKDVFGQEVLDFLYENCLNPSKYNRITHSFYSNDGNIRLSDHWSVDYNCNWNVDRDGIGWNICAAKWNEGKWYLLKSFERILMPLEKESEITNCGKIGNFFYDENFNNKIAVLSINEDDN